MYVIFFSLGPGSACARGGRDSERASRVSEPATAHANLRPVPPLLLVWHTTSSLSLALVLTSTQAYVSVYRRDTTLTPITPGHRLLKPLQLQVSLLSLNTCVHSHDDVSSWNAPTSSTSSIKIQRSPRYTLQGAIHGTSEFLHSKGCLSSSYTKRKGYPGPDRTERFIPLHSISTLRNRFGFGYSLSVSG
jgi:hypothetical protein